MTNIYSKRDKYVRLWHPQKQVLHQRRARHLPVKEKKMSRKKRHERQTNLPEGLLLSWPPCRNKEQRNVTDKGNSYSSRDNLNLGGLRSRSRGLNNRGSLGRRDLLDGGRGGNSFSGRHYKRDKDELNE
jgi:hypothetical protein